MKNKMVIAAAVLMMGGCANLKYPNWEYVRIESTIPDKSCVYKMQESCSDDGNGCLEWHQKRATKYYANTVVITDKSNHNQFSTGMMGPKGSDQTTTLADYYYCNGAKNINPVN
ncbi:MAG: hypothetical protein Q7T96_01585 [Methylobacter sp.]|nr:hypothetical protein [Methylobacter sp.]